MGSARKEQSKVARAEAVQRLRALAGELERGKVVVGGKELEVPDHVRLEIKADRDELGIELEWGAPPRAPSIEEQTEEEALAALNPT